MSCPGSLVIESRLHLILVLHDLVSLVTFNILQNFLSMCFVFVPAHHIEVRLFCLQAFEHCFVLFNNNLMITQPFLKIKTLFALVFVLAGILTLEEARTRRD